MNKPYRAAGIIAGGFVFALLAACAAPRRAQQASAAPAPVQAAAQPPRQAYIPDPSLPGAAGVINYSFERGRDAAADIKLAVEAAAASGRRVLLEVGGTWCSWCGRLDRFFAANPDLVALRDSGFVMVRVHSRRTEPNPALAALPAVPGYPHFFVLGPDGTLLLSQETTPLEAGESYDAARVGAFLREAAAPRP